MPHRDLGLTPVSLCCSTGLHTSDDGARLDALLDLPVEGPRPEAPQA